MPHDNIPCPVLWDYLCLECDTHFKEVEEGLSGLNIAYTINRRLVRGMDYYTKTTFEVTTTHLGAQNAVAAGGRYDRLVQQLGGPNVPAVGMAIGMERLAQLMPSDTTPKKPLMLFMLPLGAASKRFLLPCLYHLRRKDIKTDMGDSNKNLKNQLKYADYLKAQYVLIVGENELKENEGILRDMTTHQQEKIPLDGLIDRVINRILSKKETLHEEEVD